MRTSRLLPLAVTALAASSSLSACGGAPPPTMEGRDGLLSRTAIAQKCEEAAKGHDKPFVIEWDATDLASFEARAKQATVFVKYTGCELEVLYECKDETNTTAFGTYGVPQPTSGTRQGFDISNEGDLYASLPLGAAKLGGRVSAGESLHLDYFVSGVATASRDSLYQGELARIPACAEATHFVWAYNLGAFELQTKQRSSAEADASIAGFGAGGSRKSEESALSRGGKLESCDTNDQRACKVPIRLALRSIKSGDHPGSAGSGFAGGAPAGTQAATTNAILEQAQAQESANSVYMEAVNKYQEDRDGKACLARLDRALTLDSRIVDQAGAGYMRIRSLCTMNVGRCDEGSNMYRTMLQGADTKRVRTDEGIDFEVRREANAHCPASTAKNPIDELIRLSSEAVGAAKAGDVKSAKAKFDRIEKLIPQADELARKADRNSEAGRNESTFGHRASSGGKSTLDAIAVAVAKAEGCAAGLVFHKRAYRMKLPDMNPESVDKTATESWQNLQTLKQVECK